MMCHAVLAHHLFQPTSALFQPASAIHDEGIATVTFAPFEGIMGDEMGRLTLHTE